LSAGAELRGWEEGAFHRECGKWQKQSGDCFANPTSSAFIRKPLPQPGCFLTTSPNTLIKPIYEKAMPVIITTPEEADVWMNAHWSEAKGPAEASAG
jgi:putative SOS response-associated peptidase YedK